MPKNKCPECPKPGAKWMTTFTDMLFILLTFFVLLVSMATFDKRKIVEALSFFQQGGRGLLEWRTSDDSNPPTIIPSPMRVSQQQQQSRDQAVQAISEYVHTQNMQQSVSVVKTDKGFTISILDSVLFRSGSSELLPEARPVLDRIASIALDNHYYINIEGHTDDRPMPGTATNWDLSVNRATSVLKYMITQRVQPERLSATGMAQYHPFLPNITEENRARNRRVEMNFISPEYFESGKNPMRDNP